MGSLLGFEAPEMPDIPPVRVPRTPIRTPRRNNAETMTQFAEMRRRRSGSGYGSTVIAGAMGTPTGTVGGGSTLG